MLVKIAFLLAQNTNHWTKSSIGLTHGARLLERYFPSYASLGGAVISRHGGVGPLTATVKQHEEEGAIDWTLTKKVKVIKCESLGSQIN